MKAYRRAATILLLAMCLGAGVRAQAEDAGTQPQRFVRHMSGVETCLVCHGSYNIEETLDGDQHHSLWIDPGMFLESVHARLGCTACHTGIDENGHRLISPGGSGGRGCLPCHEVSTPAADGQVSDRSPALDLIAGDRRVVSDALKACISCHPGQYLQYKDSIHGVDVLANMEQDPPFCIDCHGSHYILHSSDERAWTNPRNIPLTCLKCHAEATIQQRFDLRKNVGETFEESFHGLRGEAGGNVAVCINCHGSHEIYAATDARSKVNALNISDTCGECHEGAQLNFASAFTHTEVSRTELTGLYAVIQTHKWMIVGVLTPLVFLVLSDLLRQLLKRRAAKHD